MLEGQAVSRSNTLKIHHKVMLMILTPLANSKIYQKNLTNTKECLKLLEYYFTTTSPII